MTNFPSTGEYEKIGYLSVFSGQPTYNGVALLSREPATDIVTNLSGYDRPTAPGSRCHRRRHQNL